MRRISWAMVLIGAIATAGCGGGGRPASSAGTKGTAGVDFSVKVNNQGPGTVTSNQGNTCAANTTCDWTFASGTTVVLTATATGSNYFNGWFGHCSGAGTCSMSGDADKYVVAYFSASPQSHPNWTDHTVHGPAYAAFAAGNTTALNCTSCHGADLKGRGLAVSCTGCHAWPTHGKIVLRDANGAALTKSSTVPYNPKATCGASGCHGPSWSKITEAYHFSQGRTNGKGSILISDNYSAKPWVMSDGMYGKW